AGATVAGRSTRSPPHHRGPAERQRLGRPQAGDGGWRADVQPPRRRSLPAGVGPESGARGPRWGRADTRTVPRHLRLRLTSNGSIPTLRSHPVQVVYWETLRRAYVDRPQRATTVTEPSDVRPTPAARRTLLLATLMVLGCVALQAIAVTRAQTAPFAVLDEPPDPPYNAELYRATGASAIIQDGAIVVSFDGTEDTYVPGIGWLSGVGLEPPTIVGSDVLMSADLLDALGIVLPRLEAIRTAGDALIRVVLDVPDLDHAAVADITGSGVLAEGETLTLQLPALLLPADEPEDVAGIEFQVRSAGGGTSVALTGPALSYEYFTLATPTR